MLKYSYDNEADIPADQKAFYALKDGKWVLQVDGMVARAKLDEFRDNNTALTKELNDFKAKFKDVDPAKFTELLAIETDLRNGKVKDGKTVEQILEERTGVMKKAHADELEKLKGENQQLHGSLSKLTINDAVVREATAKGLRETAVDDVIARAQRTFKIEGGKVVAFDGEKQRYNKAGEAFTMNDFVEELIGGAPHLFKDSSGTGSQQQQQGGAYTGPNPWAKGTANLTEQGKLIKADPKKAKQLAQAAGVTLVL